MAVNPGNFPVASLYVGDLTPDVSEAILYEKFSQNGKVEVLSIRVCRDMVSKRSLGYAYVNFQNQLDAERALDTMNFDRIKGQPCRIMWSQRDPSLRRSGVGNIFIKNLDKSIDHKAMYDTFSAFGNILSCKVALDENSQSRGFGFVHFDTQESADLAIKKVNGMLLNDKKVYVGKFVPRKDRTRDQGANQRYTNVYVKNFGDDFEDDDLHQAFEKFGKIYSAVVMKDETGKGRGFGFVSFENHESAARAVEEMNNGVLNNHQIYCGRAQKRKERQMELIRRREEQKMERYSRYHGVNLYIKNLEDDFSDEKLREEFNKFGNITSAKIMVDEIGHSRGFGFVCFSSPEEATKAVTEMNGRIVVSKPLYVALAQRKDERAAHLAALRMQRMARGMPQGQMQMYPPYYMPGIQSHQRAYFPPAMTGFRWQGGPVHRPYGFSGMHHRTRPGVPRSGGMSNTQQRITNTGSRIGPQQRGSSVTQTQQQPQPRTQQQYKLNPSARNQPGTQSQTQGTSGPQPLILAELTQADPQQQKQIIGEHLYRAIMQMHPEKAGKITGMLLEMDNSELLHMLESPESLNSKVDEAVGVLLEHQRQDEQIALQIPPTGLPLTSETS